MTPSQQISTMSLATLTSGSSISGWLSAKVALVSTLAGLPIVVTCS